VDGGPSNRLRPQGRDGRIFISYRATDGAAIAKELYDHLMALGHRPYLDEAKELDGDFESLSAAMWALQVGHVICQLLQPLLPTTSITPGSPHVPLRNLTITLYKRSAKACKRSAKAFQCIEAAYRYSHFWAVLGRYSNKRLQT